MSKEFLSLDEFMALLASHGYQWGSIETINLLLEAFYSEALTPVFFYDGVFGWAYSYWNGTLAEHVTVKEGFSTLRGYFSIHKSDLIEFYKDMEDIAETWYFGSRINAHKTYGEPPPTLSDNSTHFGYNSRIELGAQHPHSEHDKIEHCYIYIYDDDHQIAFNELVYPTEQVQKLLATDDTATPAQLASLTNELEQARAIIEQQKERIAELEQASKPLHYKTADNASKIISALASELLKMDITRPLSKASNGVIKSAIERQGNTLGKDTIAEWLKLAHKNSI